MKAIRFRETICFGEGTEGNELYKKTVVGDTKMYAQFRASKSPHIIAPSFDAIASSKVSESLRKALVPLISLDLSALNDGLTQKIPIFYYEKTNISWLVSRLDDENKVQEIVFYDTQGNFIELEELMEAYAEEPLDSFYEDYKEKQLHIIKHEPIPNPRQIISQEDYKKYQEVWWSQLKEEVSGEIFSRHIGPYPLPVQWKLEYPIMEDTEETFYFVASVRAADFDLLDVDYYIYYHPEERMVVQYMQRT